MVRAVIEDFLVERILVDSGNAVDVLHWDAFQKLGYKESTLRKTSPIYGFSNQPIQVKSAIVLMVILGDGQNTVKEKAEFVMVDQPSAYNAIFGRPLMRATKMVIATFCMKVRFPTASGDGYMECNQRTGRCCGIAVALPRKGDKSGTEAKIL